MHLKISKYSSAFNNCIFGYLDVFKYPSIKHLDFWVFTSIQHVKRLDIWMCLSIQEHQMVGYFVIEIYSNAQASNFCLLKYIQILNHDKLSDIWIYQSIEVC